MSASTALASLEQLSELAGEGPLRFTYLSVRPEGPWSVQIPGVALASEHFVRGHIGVGATVDEAAEHLHRQFAAPEDGWHVTVDALEIRGKTQRLVWTAQGWTEAGR